MQTRKTPPQTAVGDWLAYAHDKPEDTRLEWARDRLALLPLGRRFDSVRIPVEVVRSALINVRPAAVSPLLAQLLGGPVIQDTDRWFYPLVPVGGTARWRSRAAAYLSQGWLRVPQEDQLAPPGAHWVVPMTEPGRLCDLTGVAELVEVGAARLSGEEAAC